MRRVFFHVLMLMSTHPDSQASSTKASAILEARPSRCRVRERREMRIRIGTRARAMSDQSRAIKPAVGLLVTD